MGQLIASKTGHGDFDTCHTRFKYKEANTNCLCGSPKAPTQFLFCRILRRGGGRPSGAIAQLSYYLLCTPEGDKNLEKSLKNTKFFEVICPR